MNTIAELPKFETEEDAWAWMYEQIDDPCVDNERLAYDDDPEMMREYFSQEENGCCGSFDAEVVINGQEANIGCNYGH